MPKMHRRSRQAWIAAGLIAGLSACGPQRSGQLNMASAVEPAVPKAETTVPDAALKRLIPAEMRLRLSARGDLDGDGDEDAVVVLDGEGIDSANRARPLLLLRRQENGRLEIAVESPNAILCRRCGGMAGDPLHSIRVSPGGFTLRFEGGSRELWSSEFAFGYSAPSGQWRLLRVEHAGFDRGGEGAHAERALTAQDIGDVSLAEFDASDYPADALP